MIQILSVKYGPAHLLQWNAELTRALNRQAVYEWIVVNNDFDGDFARSGGPFTVVQGVNPSTLSGTPFKDRGSAHHAAGLMEGLKHVTRRWLLLLDQDFYAVRPQWLQDVVTHADTHGLAFLGSVWHPRWTYQPRDFPSVHFLLIDLAQVPVSTLDFRPDMTGDRIDIVISDPRLPIRPSLRTLLQVGRFRDTGWRVRQRYRRSGLTFERLVPHLDRRAALREAHPLHQLTNPWLPERRRVVPADPATFTTRSFLRSASELAYRGRWEEFWWQGEPFAFHLRSVGRSVDEGAQDHAELRRLLYTYTAGTPR